MTRAEKTLVEFIDNTPTSNMSTEIGAVSGFLIQDNFYSDQDREEFMQAITSHGILFLRCSSLPLPKPTKDDLSLIEKISKALSNIWPSCEERRCCNDA